MTLSLSVPNLAFMNINSLTFKKLKFKISFDEKKIRCINNILNYAQCESPCFIALLDTRHKSSLHDVKRQLFSKYFFLSDSCCTNNDSSSGIIIFCHNQFTNRIFTCDVIITGRAISIKYVANEITYHIIFLYLPQKSRTAYHKSCVDKISAYLDRNLGQADRLILAGDFNKKAEDIFSLSQKFSLFDVFDIHGNHSPTWTGQGRNAHQTSRIDLILSNFSPRLWSFVNQFYTSISDHTLMVISQVKSSSFSPIPKWTHTDFKNDRMIAALYKTCMSILKTRNIELYNDLINFKDHKLAIKCFDEWTDENLPFDAYSQLFNNIHSSLTREYFKQKKSLKLFQTREDMKIHSLLDKAYKKKHLSPFEKTEILKIKNNRKADLAKQIESSRQSIQHKKLVNGAKPTKFSYRFINMKSDLNIPPLKMHNGQLAKTDEEILDTLRDYYSECTAGQPFQNSMAYEKRADSFNFHYDSILQKYGFDAKNAFQPQFALNDNVFTPQEVLKVILSMKSDSAPGPSGQNKAYFLFLFRLIPNWLTSFINYVAFSNDIDSDEFSFLKKRKVIYIHKPNKPKNETSSYRPISLLEVSYKIISKLFAKRIEAFLTELVSPNQFGFVPTRQMAQASHSMLANMQHIQNNKINACVILLDIKAAFDRVLTDSISQLLHIIFPESYEFIKAYNIVTAGGECVIATNGQLSSSLFLRRGVPQGDPSSSIKYVIAHHLFIKFISHIQYKQGWLTHTKFGRPLDGILFADDTALFASFTNQDQIENFISALNDFESLIGLKINPAKTNILIPNNFQSTVDLSSLGVIVNHATHLGVEISFDRQLAKTETYKKLTAKFKSKQKLIRLTSPQDLFHRKLIITSLLSSLALHIVRIYPPSKIEAESFDKIIKESLWLKCNEESTNPHHEISHKRLQHPISVGGLQLKSFFDTASITWIKSINTTIKSLMADINATCEAHSTSADDEKNTLLFAYDQTHLAMQAFPLMHYAVYGSKFTTDFKIISKLFSTPTKDNFDFYKITLAHFEKQQQYAGFSSIFYNPNFQTIRSFSEDLYHYNIEKMRKEFLNKKGSNSHFRAVNLYSVLRRFKHDKKEKLASPQIDIDPELNERIGLIFLRCLNLFPKKFSQHGMGVPFQCRGEFFRSFTHAALLYIFPDLIKTIHQDRLIQESPKISPSYGSRARDHVPSPNRHKFTMSYKLLSQSSIPSPLRSFQLKLLNRSLFSKNKDKKINKEAPVSCPLCEDIWTSFHTTSECIIPTMYRRLVDFIISFHPHFYSARLTEFDLEYTRIDKDHPFSIPEQKAFAHLNIEIKRLAFYESHSPSFSNITQFIILAKILNVIKNVTLFFRLQKKPSDLIEFFNFIMIEYFDKLTDNFDWITDPVYLHLNYPRPRPFE